MKTNCYSTEINRKRLEQVTSQKLLGVIIDDTLNFDDDIEELCKKITQRIAVLKKIICFMPLEQRMLYFNSMIKQVMLYGSSLWTSNTIDSLAKVLKLKKRAARVILNADTRDNSAELFTKLGWLPFYDEAKIIKCLHVFRRLVGYCPSYMNSLLRRNADVHSRESRHGDFNLVCPRFKRENRGRAFIFSINHEILELLSKRYLVEIIPFKFT